MAIVDGLTTLAAVKIEAGIAVSDTSQDTTLEAFITSASAAICMHLKRDVKRTTYTDDMYAVNNHQFLYLTEYPIQSVASITLTGATLVLLVDYSMSRQDAKAGRIYRPSGWTGTCYSRGTFPDTFAGARDIKITYTAGWYLPADPLYVAGDSTALPIALQYACNRAVIMRYRIAGQNADGLKSLSEGGLSYTWIDPSTFKAGNSGFDDVTASMLAPFVRHEPA